MSDSITWTPGPRIVSSSWRSLDWMVGWFTSSVIPHSIDHRVVSIAVKKSKLMEKEGKCYADQLHPFQLFFPNRVEEEISRYQSSFSSDGSFSLLRKIVVQVCHSCSI